MSSPPPVADTTKIRTFAKEADMHEMLRRDVLEATRRLTLAWLQTALGAEEGAWLTSCLALDGEAAPLATVTEKKPYRKFIQT